LGLGSFPSFEPALFSRPLTQKQVDDTYRNPLAPLADRVISGLYPTGSTFKPITAIAALESGNLHLSEAIEDPGELVVGGQVLKEFGPKPRRHVRIDPEYRAAILEGLHDAAQNGSGTSFEVFGSFPIAVAGKTGTAQRPPHLDQSWYGVLAPYPNPRIVTFVT